jgi:hypothetical protein
MNEELKMDKILLLMILKLLLLISPCPIGMWLLCLFVANKLLEKTNPKLNKATRLEKLKSNAEVLTDSEIFRFYHKGGIKTF